MNAFLLGSLLLSADIVEVRKIWDQAPHNAFTDLTRFDGRWFCVFREGKGHVSPDGTVRVLTSADGAKWESAARLERPGWDLRDAKIVVTPDGKRLMLVGGAAVREGTKPATLTESWTAFSKDGRAWGPLQTVGTTNRWLWRVTWHDGKAYGVDYGVAPAERAARKYTTALLASEDGVKFKTLVERLHPEPGTTEATLRFAKDGTMFCLQRRDGAKNSALLGRSVPPYAKWEWRDLGRYFGGPNFIELPSGAWVACGRLVTGGAPKTVLCALDVERGELKPLVTLPSGGDCSYPGLVWHDGLLWISYYSSHEGKTSIYLAKVRLP